MAPGNGSTNTLSIHKILTGLVSGTWLC